MEKEDQKKKKRLRKIISEFAQKIGFMSELDQTSFGKSWIDKKD
jgi:hypothetical protein